jgi:hypothetical protein
MTIRPSYPTTADLWLRSSPPLQGASFVTDPISTFSALLPVKREPWTVSHHGSLYLVELMNDSSSRCAVLHSMSPDLRRPWPVLPTPVSEALSLVADRDIYVTGESMFDAFWRTLMAHSDSRPLPPVFGSTTASGFSRLISIAIFTGKRSIRSRGRGQRIPRFRNLRAVLSPIAFIGSVLAEGSVLLRMDISDYYLLKLKREILWWYWMAHGCLLCYGKQ